MEFGSQEVEIVPQLDVLEHHLVLTLLILCFGFKDSLNRVPDVLNCHLVKHAKLLIVSLLRKLAVLLQLLDPPVLSLVLDLFLLSFEDGGELGHDPRDLDDLVSDGLSTSVVAVEAPSIWVVRVGYHYAVVKTRANVPARQVELLEVSLMVLCQVVIILSDC